jgi:CheY-like chemotaxis protein
MTDPLPPRILCIEDNAVNWRLVQRLLSKAGYDMYWAEEGLRGYEMALELKPDLVLLDINLPGLSGFEVASKFRQNPELTHIPLIALTAKTMKSERETALVAGCEGFIPKPLDPFTFVDQVGAYLGGRRDYLDQAREGPALREYNVQVLGHLETRLKESQEANRKLLAAQEALELRNKSLSRLLALSQDILTEHDPMNLLVRILTAVRAEVGATGLQAFRLHPSGGYLTGLKFNGDGFEPTPVLPVDHAFATRALGMVPGEIVRGEALRENRIWDQGLALGYWAPVSEACLLVLGDHQDRSRACGFWILSRPADQRLLPPELEMITLHASISQVSLENAELIDSLNNSTRALASSYERIEGAYQDLQNARAVLNKRDRQALLGDLFARIAQRLEAPVASLHLQSQVLDGMLVAPGAAAEGAPQTQALGEIREAVARIDQLLKALLRRVGREGPSTPELLDLHDLIQQELGLLQAEGVIAPEVVLALELGARAPAIFGVYGDFAAALQNLARHGLAGPTPSASLMVRTSQVGDEFILEMADEGGVIPPSLLEMAFEPFSGLHQEAVIGIRSPGDGLAACKQLMAAYQGELAIANEGEGTTVSLRFPLH